MKIALYLGSFNPFHNGHLEVVKTALNDFKMDKVIIVPTMQNPAKKEKALDIDKRKQLIEFSLRSFEYLHRSFPKTEISLIEKELIPPYYSYATLHALKNKYCNDEIFVLTTNETLERIPDWMFGEQILKDYSFLIVDRPKESISSSQIREILKNKNKLDNYTDGKLKYFVSPSVIELLKKYY